MNKSIKSKFGLLIIALFTAMIITEVLIRILPESLLTKSLAYKIAEKKVHCYNSDLDLIQLCPNIQVKLFSPLGFEYIITTDLNGERITSNSDVNLNSLKYNTVNKNILNAKTTFEYSQNDSMQKTDISTKENQRIIRVWAIGDSLTMGYGIHDEESLPYLLSDYGFQVRNFASDSLGAHEIFKILQTNLDKSGKRGENPDFIVWIFSRSDFYDDKLSRSSTRNFIKKITFNLSKYSRTVLAAKTLLENWRLQNSSNDYNFIQKEVYIQPPEDHPTLIAIQNIRNLSSDSRIIPIIILAPDWNHINGEPELNTEYFEFIKSYFDRLEFTVIDMSKTFANRSGDELYLPNDGHPSALAHRLIAKKTYSLLEKITKSKLKIDKRL